MRLGPKCLTKACPQEGTQGHHAHLYKGTGTIAYIRLLFPQPTWMLLEDLYPNCRYRREWKDWTSSDRELRATEALGTSWAVWLVGLGARLPRSYLVLEAGSEEGGSVGLCCDRLCGHGPRSWGWPLTDSEARRLECLSEEIL